MYDDDRSQPLKNRVLGYARRADGSYHRIGMNSSTVGAIGLKTTVGDLHTSEAIDLQRCSSILTDATKADRP
jgi:hypothetical protein